MDALIKRFFSSDKPDAATPEQDGLNSPSLPTPSSELILAVIPRELINIIFRTLTDGDVLFFRCSCRSARRLCLLIRPNILELCKHKIFSYAAVSVPLLEWSVKSHRIKFKGKVAEEALVAAAAGGHLESLRWIKKTTKCLVPPAASIEAARMGHLAILQDLRHVAEPALIAVRENLGFVVPQNDVYLCLGCTWRPFSSSEASHSGTKAANFPRQCTNSRHSKKTLQSRPIPYWTSWTENRKRYTLEKQKYSLLLRPLLCFLLLTPFCFLLISSCLLPLSSSSLGTAHVMCAAAATGNIVLLELLHTNSYRITPYTIDCAVAAGKKRSITDRNV